MSLFGVNLRKYRKLVVAAVGLAAIILFDPTYLGLGDQAQGVFDQVLALLTALGVYAAPNDQE